MMIGFRQDDSVIVANTPESYSMCKVRTKFAKIGYCSSFSFVNN